MRNYLTAIVIGGILAIVYLMAWITTGALGIFLGYGP